MAEQLFLCEFSSNTNGDKLCVFFFRKKIESDLTQEIINGVSRGISNHISGYFSVIKGSTEITESGI